jgi:hypothetical protein
VRQFTMRAAFRQNPAALGSINRFRSRPLLWADLDIAVRSNREALAVDIAFAQLSATITEVVPALRPGSTGCPPTPHVVPIRSVQLTRFERRDFAGRTFLASTPQHTAPLSGS